MISIQITLPDEVAHRAKIAGLLSNTAIQQLLEEALRQRAGRALVDLVKKIHSAGIPPMSMEKIDAEVKAQRAERRAHAAARRKPAGDASSS